jgi:hypothetical protein
MYLLPNIFAPVDLLRLMEEIEVAAWPIHVYPIRAARFVMAADIHVTQASDAVVIEALDHLRCVEPQELVVVPGVAVGVHEEDGVGELIVVVNYVGEVNLDRNVR